MAEELVKDLSSWLAREFDLPVVEELPRIAFVPAATMPSVFRLAIEAQAGLSDKAAGSGLNGSTSSTVLAFYRTDNETIYLPSDWSMSNVLGISILVHELVHHIQHKSGMRYSCWAERELLAFEAQERWLAMHGRSLEADFGLDHFTLLFRTRCLF